MSRLFIILILTLLTSCQDFQRSVDDLFNDSQGDCDVNSTGFDIKITPNQVSIFSGDSITASLSYERNNCNQSDTKSFVVSQVITPSNWTAVYDKNLAFPNQLSETLPITFQTTSNTPIGFYQIRIQITDRNDPEVNKRMILPFQVTSIPQCIKSSPTIELSSDSGNNSYNMLVRNNHQNCKNQSFSVDLVMSSDFTSSIDNIISLENGETKNFSFNINTSNANNGTYPLSLIVKDSSDSSFQAVKNSSIVVSNTALCIKQKPSLVISSNGRDDSGLFHYIAKITNNNTDCPAETHSLALNLMSEFQSNLATTLSLESEEQKTIPFVIDTGSVASGDYALNLEVSHSNFSYKVMQSFSVSIPLVLLPLPPQITSVTRNGESYSINFLLNPNSMVPQGGYDTYINNIDQNDSSSFTSLTRIITGLNVREQQCFNIEARYTQLTPAEFKLSNQFCIEASQPTCVKQSPGVIVNPVEVESVIGADINYSIYLKNNNTNCPEQSYSLTHQALPQGASSNLTSQTLASGETKQIAASITVPGVVDPGTFSTSLEAKDMTESMYSSLAGFSITLIEDNSQGGGGDDLHTHINAASVNSEVNQTTGWVEEGVNISSFSDSSYPSNSYAIKVQSTGGSWDRVAIPFEGQVGSEITVKLVAKKGIGEHQRVDGLVGIEDMEGVDIDSATYREYTLTGKLTQPNPIFKIYVQAREGTGSGASSNNTLYIASIQILETPTVVDSEAPSVPTSLTQSGISPYSASLTWGESSDNIEVAGYVLKQDNQIIGNTSTNSYFVSGLSPSSLYTFKVKAIDSSGNESSFSEPVSVATPKASTNSNELKAFPLAYGGGAYATGGRGGEVRKVTNLNDSGAGSLRAALQGNDPKIIVFGVSGVIKLNSTIFVNSNTTIAGQTAPQGGITISAYGYGRVACQNEENIIIRYIKIRPEYASGNDAVKFYGCSNTILDHVSASWGGDEIVSFTGYQRSIKDITVQRSILGEGKTGSLLGDSDSHDSEKLSFTTSLFYNVTHRFPNVNSKGRADVLNNVVFNYKYRMNSLHGNIKLNMLNNYYKKACFLSNPTNENFNRMTGGRTGQSNNAKVHISGNLVTPNTHTSATADNWYFMQELYQQTPGNYVYEPLALSYRQVNMFTPLIGAQLPIMSATTAYQSVLADVGANKRLGANGEIVLDQDVIDSMYISNTAAGDCVSYSSSSSSQNYNTFAHYLSFHDGISSTPFATGYMDSDNDGMPNIWESANGLNPNVNDSAGDLDGDGYTNIEEFLNLIDL